MIKRACRRGWLNSVNSYNNGHYKSVVTVWDEEKKLYAHGDLSIADCNRKITLAFPVTRKSDRTQSLNKLNKLIQSLKDFKKDLIDTKKFLKN